MMTLSTCFFVLVLCLSASASYAQDTLRILRFPRMDEVNEVVTATVTRVDNKMRFEYRIKSLPTSKQDIWTFDVPFEGNVENVSSPEGWIGLSGRGVLRISWGGDSLHFIRPGNSLTGFGYESLGLPSIKTYYVSGWTEPPVLDFEPDSVVGGNILEDSKKGQTIGAIKPPEPFIPLTFLNTLVSYKHQAFSLGWIKNKGIVQSLDAKLENAKRQLQRNNKTAARNMLQAFVNEVEALWKAEEHPYGGRQITSEAYALLKFNAEYLIAKL